MLFTDPLFFEFEPIKIANVSGNGNVAADLSRFIGIYEKQCLIEILGPCLYKDVMDSYTFDDGTHAFKIKDDATQAIKDLVNGKSYDAPETNESNWGCGCGCGSANCTKRYWKGFVQSDECLIGNALTTSKRSFIADYIYYHYLLINRTVTTGTGQQKLKGENSETFSNFSKRIDRYNEFVFAVVGRKNETSLYWFLQDNKTAYPTWDRNCSIKFKDKW